MSGRPQPGDPDFPYMLADTPEEFERVRRAAWPAPSPAAAGLPLEDVERVSPTDADRAKARRYWLDARYDEDAEPEEVIAQVIADTRAAAALAEMRPTTAVPDPANLDQLAADAVITFQVSMVGPRMVSGLPVFDIMSWEEREVWREYVRAILRDEVPPGNFPEQTKAWQNVARMVRDEVSR